jgi:16S rRNA (guanine527-N7)-methyltransferase
VAIRHVIDSLTALSWLREHGVGRLLDLGSGGGFPGIPLAAAAPSVEVTLVEPIGKKARFLETATAAIGLAGRVTTRRMRAEDLGREPDERERWQAVTARAVASTADLVELAFPLLTPGGALLAWKRGESADEVRAGTRAAATLGGGSIRVLEVGVRELGDHRLVVVTRDPSGRVPPGYPRDPAVRRRHPW